jgi:phosphoribosylaminoimidazole-succinocarboxamide synthase
MNKGFSGQAGQKMPKMDDKFVRTVSERYIELYEQLTGEKFVPDKAPNILKRIESNVEKTLKDLK